MAASLNFSGALATWKGKEFNVEYSYILNCFQDINLSDLQKTLDVQGIEVVDNQKESVIGRKLLADKTKGI